MLLTALLAFAASLLLDDRFARHGEIDPDLLEDGAKLIGIVAWLAYYFRSAVAAIAGLSQAARSPGQRCTSTVTWRSSPIDSSRAR